VIGVTDLEAASTEMAATLGRGQSWRGRHPSYGTENVLFRLDNGYIELLAPDPASRVSTFWTDSLRDFLSTRDGGLFAVALSTPNVERSVESILAAGVSIDPAAPGEGVDLKTAAVRHWSNARIRAEASRGTPALVIEHRSPPEALPPATYLADRTASVASVLGLSIETVDMEGAARFWGRSLQLTEAPLEGGRSFGLGDAVLLIYPGAGEGPHPDRWYSLTLGVESVSATADRLDRAHIEFRQGDFREGYGLRLDICGADVLLAETL
jgi:hypothetical protein